MKLRCVRVKLADVKIDQEFLYFIRVDSGIHLDLTFFRTLGILRKIMVNTTSIVKAPTTEEGDKSHHESDLLVREMQILESSGQTQ